MNEDPYEVLGLDSAATEVQIRQRYLERVRQHPPDRNPEEFERTRAAYELLRDPVARMERQLFDMRKTDTFEAIRKDFVRSLRDDRFDTGQLMKLAEAP